MLDQKIYTFPSNCSRFYLPKSTLCVWIFSFETKSTLCFRWRFAPQHILILQRRCTQPRKTERKREEEKGEEKRKKKKGLWTKLWRKKLRHYYKKKIRRAAGEPKKIWVFYRQNPVFWFFEWRFPRGGQMFSKDFLGGGQIFEKDFLGGGQISLTFPKKKSFPIRAKVDVFDFSILICNIWQIARCVWHALAICRK